MSHSVSYRFVRVSTAFEDLEGYALLRDYYGIEVNGELLVKENLGNTLYLVKVSELPDYSAEDNWFTIEAVVDLRLQNALMIAGICLLIRFLMKHAKNLAFIKKGE